MIPLSVERLLLNLFIEEITLAWKMNDIRRLIFDQEGFSILKAYKDIDIKGIGRIDGD